MRGRGTAAAGLALALAAGLAQAADPVAGAEHFRRLCAGCHGANGRPVLPAAPDFTQPAALLKSDLTLVAVVRDGRGAMPAFRGQLREREMVDVVAYLRTLR